MIQRGLKRRGLIVGAVVAATALALVGCSAGSGASSNGKITITYLVDNAPNTTATAAKLVAAFEKANPNITVKVESRAQGADGDNIVKTKLATGDMEDVFQYNSGSQIQGDHPDQTLVDLSGESWAKDVTDDFKASVSGTTKGAFYGAPWGTSFSGGIMYNTKVYDKLGLKVPTTWDDFISNSQKIKAAGIVPILQTFGDTWTSQLFVLADFANVSAKDKTWAADYTANKADAKYAKQPGLRGFQYTEDVFKAGLVNEDYASLTNANGLKELAEGTAAQYPMITTVLGNVQQSNPDQVNDIGYFAIPTNDGSTPHMTVWEPNALYIPKTTKDAKLAAAKKFVAFANSKAGCEIQAGAQLPTGPFATTACTLPSDVPTLVKQEQKYQDDGNTGLALEFLSPIKGPNLEKILIEVGTGQATAEQGAALYDQDVKAQAQQLGIKGW
ncbi:ABC transporter substrate-binding protein [Parafrigoribacterium humi]|uniref:ABC transporter substrate-binding protein n=1 Tax=Parafrigoribacterium humi TaxID=3144664 RepID=UPI0032EF557A